MDWKGKLVGGAMGFALGGPVGAIAGALFGHMFDGKDAAYARGPSKHASDLNQAYSVLECAPSDSDADIRQAYRRKVREFHPDAVAARKTSEEFIRFSRERFQEILNSYEIIQKERTQRRV